ncbi:MAG: YtxH domain-containing protein [Chloroflexota bacterium]|nr:YtxH domain-containing protein [Chloroflexota bacterium]MDE3101373.1 YtxH domain-containing protein [Chloroflexota bacterium]
MKDIKDLNDLKEMNTNDVVELLDELRGIASRRGSELVSRGRASALRAMGATERGSMGTAFFVGIAVGAAVGAFVAMLMTPLEGSEARRRLGRQVDRARERMPDMRGGGNGRSVYERTGYEGVGERPVASGPDGMAS